MSDESSTNLTEVEVQFCDWKQDEMAGVGCGRIQQDAVVFKNAVSPEVVSAFTYYYFFFNIITISWTMYEVYERVNILTFCQQFRI